jgi:hypothetical protein
MKRTILVLTVLLLAPLAAMAQPTPTGTEKILPSDWNAKQAADKVLAGLVNISAPQVKGAHDSDFVIVEDLAYVVSIANDVQPGESAAWAFCYVALSVVNLKTRAVEKILAVAGSEQAYENATLPPGACFVPRILRKDARTLRCFFASEAPKMRQAQTWFRDYDLQRMAFENRIHRAKIKTSKGIFDMQPQPFYEDAVAQGFTREPKDYGLYTFGFWRDFDHRTYAILNNYPVGQNALAVLNEGLDTFEVLGHYNEPNEMKLTESAVNRLPDGTWLAISRQEGGKRNYAFSHSPDGRHWSTHEYRDCVPNGTSSKPTFDRFQGVYYLGWQESTKVNGVSRSVFNLDVSVDGAHWERKYRFETEKSFQYPTFREHRGSIYLSVTQGDSSPSRKERIMFGKLE